MVQRDFHKATMAKLWCPRCPTVSEHDPMCVATNSYVLSQWMTPRQAIGQVDPPEHADANPRVCDIVTCISEAGLVIVHARNFVPFGNKAPLCVGMHWSALVCI